MAKKSLFAKPKETKVGLKVLIYGLPSVGKSVYSMSFPDVFVIDAEAKSSVYTGGRSQFGKNVIGVLNTANYKDMLDALEEVIETKACKTLVTDSMTYIYNAMQVSAMELEEKRAIKKGNDPDDQGVSIKSWGKIRLNTNRLRGLKAKASSEGIVLIDIAHSKNITQKVGNENVVVGQEPDAQKGIGYEQDVVLRLFTDKDLATGEITFKAEVEKDTTGTFKIGTIIDNPTYENTFKSFLESNDKLEIAKTSYDKTIDNNMQDMNNETQSFDEVRDEFVSIYKSSDSEQKDKIKALLKEHDCAKYNDIANFDKLKVVLETIKSW